MVMKNRGHLVAGRRRTCRKAAGRSREAEKRARMLRPLILAPILLAATPYATQERPATVVLDASRASAGIMRVHEQLPASPGAFTIVYPKWIPGEHGPTGPLNDLAALRVTAGGTALDWHRDPVRPLRVSR